MKSNRLQAILNLRGIAFFLFAAILLFCNSNAQAQSPAPAPELKLLSIKIESKSATRLEIVTVPTNHYLRPTEPYVYRPELGNAPKAGVQYEQFEPRATRTHFAVLRLTNEGDRAIKSIDWEYTSPHFKGDQIILFRQTSSSLKIGKGETVAVRKKLSNEYNCSMNFALIFGQQAIGQSCGRRNRRWTGTHPVEARLLKVVYEDGTVWKARP